MLTFTVSMGDVMAQPIQAVIFDLDGTLVDSLPDITTAVNYTLRKLGLPEVDRQSVQYMVGDGIRKLIERAIARHHPPSEDEVEAAFQIYIDYYDDHCTEQSYVYPGVPDLLNALRTQQLAVLSNKGERFTRKILAAFGLAPYFQLILGGDSLPTKKPHPGGIHHILQTFRVAPAQAMMVGDSTHDVEAGRAAGTVTVAALYGYRDAELLQAADIKISHPMELLPYVNGQEPSAHE